MAGSCRERIVQAIETALGGIAGIAGLTVERDRADPVEEADLDRLVIYEGGEGQSEEGFLGEDLFDLTVDIEGYAGGDTVSAAAAAAAGLRGEVDQALRANPPLGGLARDLRLAEEPPPLRLENVSARPAKGFVRSFVVTYATVEGDPFTFA